MVMRKAFQQGIEHEYPTPEDVEDLILRRGFDDFDSNADAERMMVKFTNMVDRCIAKVATNHYWGEALRYTEPMLTAMSDKDKGMKLQRGVSPSDLAYFAVLIINYYPQWLHDALKDKFLKSNGPGPDGKDPKYVDADGYEIERPKTKYTDADKGVPRLGGWNKAGRKHFYKLQKQLEQDEQNEESRQSILAIDQEALRRLRARHHLEEKEAKRAKRGKAKAQFLDREDDESEMEEMDCLDD